jgi:hypothetical protein
MKLEAEPTTSTLRRLVVDNAILPSVMPLKQFCEVPAAHLLLLLGHVQLMLNLLARRVYFVSDGIPVFLKGIAGLVADRADDFLPLWQATEMDCALFFITVYESVEEEPRSLT